MTQNKINNIVRISQITSETFKHFLEISKGKIESLVLVEGEDLIYESFVSNKLKSIIIYDESKVSEYKKYSLPIYILREEIFKKLSSYQSLPKAIGVATLELVNNDYGKKVLYLDNLQDGGNVGSLIRSALAFKYDSVILSKDCISVFSRKVIQASKGSIFKIKIGISDLQTFKNDYSIYLTTLDGENEKNIDKLREPFVLVLGNEGHGIRKEYQNLGKKIKIDIGDIDSLNVAIAGSIFMYRFN